MANAGMMSRPISDAGKSHRSGGMGATASSIRTSKSSKKGNKEAEMFQKIVQQEMQKIS